MGYRYKNGDTRPVALAIKSGVDIAAGDLVYLSSSATVTVNGDSTTTYSLAPAADLTYQSAITAVAGSTTPTVTAETGTVGSAFSASDVVTLKINLALPWGEGTLSAASGNATIAGNGDALVLTTPDLSATPATGLTVYVCSANGGSTYKHYVTHPGSGNIMILSYGKGREPGTAVAQTGLEYTQYNFSRIFAGVAAQAYDGTTFTSYPDAYGIRDGRLRVDTAGVFAFSCAASDVLREGDLVGPAKQSGSALENQKVAAVAHSSLAIGRVWKGNNLTSTVWVEIFGGRLLPSNIQTGQV